MILPGATLGVLGGGQLGRMFTMAAHVMGYRVVVLDPYPQSPAGSIADQHIQANYNDHAALQMMADECSAITTEFENVPAESLEFLEERGLVRPGSRALSIAQDRIKEKTFVRDCGLNTAPFIAVYEASDIEEQIHHLNPPMLLKTSSMGYDGKGQVKVTNLMEAMEAFEALGKQPCVLEEMVDLEREVSVLLARSVTGEAAVYPVGENHHVNGILDTTIVPAQLDPAIQDVAVDMAAELADQLGYIGVLAVEFFFTQQGDLLINEIAPRPHNSGHYTLDATVTSQFEQQVRMMCGLPPGDTMLLSPVVMVNILGDLWSDGAPAWNKLLNRPRCKLHLYGKREARPGRKMGHFNYLHPDIDMAIQMAKTIRRELGTKE